MPLKREYNTVNFLLAVCGPILQGFASLSLLLHDNYFVYYSYSDLSW